jgi:hypothetical protein
MSRAPKGEKRPADVIGNAVHVLDAGGVSGVSLAATGSGLL